MNLGLLSLLIWFNCIAYILAVHPIKLSGPENNIIKYEAENAFKNVREAVTSCNLDGIKVSGNYSLLSSDSYILFTINIPYDSEYPVNLFSYSCDKQDTKLDILANGISLIEDTLLMNAATHYLALRKGVNTIIYKIRGGSVAFDYIEIKGAIPLALRGATLNYEEIEAEKSSYQGTLIGPGRAYTTLPSEASGRQAVQLVASGDYVEFTPTQAFNAFVVRFSIPNTQSGTGQQAILNVLINGKQVTGLNVTSYYSWVYGSYPFDKEPGSGNPHHFYDDVRFFFGNTTSFPAGTKVRVVGGSPVTYTIDLMDFYNVPAPYARPANYLSVVDYGADPTGKADSVPGFTAAIAAAEKSNQGIWIPAGRFIFSYRLTVNKITVRGAGPWYTELHGYDFGFFGAPSTNVGLYDFAVFGQTITRVDTEVSTGVGGSLSSSNVQNLWIEHNKCGMWLDGPFDSLVITGVTIRNTFADGINFHQGVTNSMVQQSTIRNVGDDALAMWPQAPNSYSNNVFKFNTLALPVLANTIAIYGGSDNSATDNTIVEGAGLQTGTRFTSTALGGTTTFQRNTLVRCGSFDMYDPSSKGEGAIWLYADSGTINTPILFEDITIIDALYQAVHFYTSITGVNFTNMQVSGGSYVFQELVSGSAYAQGVVATNVSQAGIWNCGAGFTITQGPGNSGWNTTKCAWN